MLVDLLLIYYYFTSTDLHVEFSQVVIKHSGGQAAEAEVWTQTGGAGEQRVGLDSRSLEICNPCLSNT